MSPQEIGALPQTKLLYSIDSCSSVSNNYYPQNVLIDDPTDSNSRWGGVFQPYPVHGPSSAFLSRPPTLSSIHTSGQSFNPALRFGAGKAEGSLIGERPPSNLTGLGSGRGSVGLTEGRNWLLVRLDKACLLRTITFGKLNRLHPCTLKSFLVLAGMEKNNMKEVLHASLKNDTTGETFEVGWREGGEGGLPVPMRYIKIIPLSAHGQNYNTAIWYLAFGGVSDQTVVQGVFNRYTEARETRMLRLMLKHLRQNRLSSPFSALLATAPAPLILEHPLLTELHSTLVSNGDFSSSERLVSSLSAEGLFDAYLQVLPSRAAWTRLDRQTDGSLRPGPRAGHAMVVDEGDATRPARLYLFGGYDGENNLNDLWIFEDGVWREVTRRQKTLGDDELSLEPWPESRSCHKIMLEPTTGDIYLTGRYIEEEVASSPSKRAAFNGSGAREGQPTAAGTTSSSMGAPRAASSSRDSLNEFWRFSPRKGENWELLSPNTAAEGGPGPIYDHEMAIDVESHSIYIFGGSDGTFSGPYSGLFRYDITSNAWTEILKDSERGMTSRSGHCMLWNPKERSLYIFGGLRGTEYLADFWVFHPDTDTLASHSNSFFIPGGPEPGFTQRAVLDPTRQEIVLMSGLRKDSKELGIETSTTRRGVWVFDLERKSWSKLLVKGDEEVVEQLSGNGSPKSGEGGGSSKDVVMEEEEEEDIEPSARYAQQLVFDSRTETYWLFGGNAKNIRMADFWEMKIERPLKAEVERQCLVACRKQRFIEMSETGPTLDALSYLQTQLHAVIQHDDPTESEMFVSLTGHLLSRPPHLLPVMHDENGSTLPPLDVHHARTNVFNVIQSFILDASHKEPEGDLAAMVDAGMGPLVV